MNTVVVVIIQRELLINKKIVEFVTRYKGILVTKCQVVFVSYKVKHYFVYLFFAILSMLTLANPHGSSLPCSCCLA